VTPHYASVPYFMKGTDLLGILQERLARIYAPGLRLAIVRLPIALPAIETTLVWHERHEGNGPHAWLRGLMAGTGGAPHSNAFTKSGTETPMRR
jgi:hypothetical protein